MGVGEVFCLFGSPETFCAASWHRRGIGPCAWMIAAVCLGLVSAGIEERAFDAFVDTARLLDFGAGFLGIFDAVEIEAHGLAGMMGVGGFSAAPYADGDAGVGGDRFDQIAEFAGGFRTEHMGWDAEPMLRVSVGGSSSNRVMTAPWRAASDLPIPTLVPMARAGGGSPLSLL